MSNESQVSVIKSALSSEQKIQQYNSTLNKLQSSQFQSEPKEPEYSKVERTYPEVKSTLKYWPYIIGSYGGLFILAFLLGLIFRDKVTGISGIMGLLICALPILLIIYYNKVFKKKKQAQIEQIMQTPEYLNQIKELDAKYDLEDETAYNKYVQEKRQYDEVILPDYKKEKAEWEENRDKSIAETKQQLDTVQKELNELYATTKLIPSKYHSVPALSYLYDLMSTSQYDIKEAIEKYDKDQERKWDQEHKLQMERAANEQAEAAWQAAESAEQARRDQNRANLVGIYQRHKTNSILRDYMKK